ncbi:MAG: beta-lactamase [Candidatus Moranbacteria bacterium GW2011_GWC2_37_73]|nr:MAG: beta-lactamase [Parcubacteria group bacterium GW2011_GWC1_36_108]KKQ01069.1 MAG: beta-lactamase [Candidatus Moranbacteria bacterium GW2011_GWD1_36_198]KKQ02471.1 MAG: beta-lactamase [Candidatus Moranbacteria bacterium GW2011_GWD2_36_198]KKQ40129.1 MAG: beta-lactamase [Candidatus Moranbacteria bacterium GW2011_GWC2_37_73]HAS00251.1 hypothetical protein [Candidatus Moranbacteria bacterium]
MDNKKNKKVAAEFIKSNKKFVVFFLLLLLLICNVFYWQQQEKKYAKYLNGDKYVFLNPASYLIDADDALVNFQSLRDSLVSKYEKRADYMISVYFEYLPTGANISINKDEKIWPASLIKIPVAMAAMKKVSDGKWKLSNELVILDEDKDNSFGTLFQRPTGTTITIEDTIKQALIQSDNTAHFMLLRNLDGEELEEVYIDLGLDDIINDIKKTPKGEEADNRMTAKRYSIFFRSLYNASYLNLEYSQKFLDILGNAPLEYLSNGLPSDVEFVHKTGIRTEDGVRADAGIVYLTDRPYLLTVMIQKKGENLTIPEGEVEGIFKAISTEIYEYVSQAK